MVFSPESWGRAPRSSVTVTGVTHGTAPRIRGAAAGPRGSSFCLPCPALVAGVTVSPAPGAPLPPPEQDKGKLQVSVQSGVLDATAHPTSRRAAGAGGVKPTPQSSSPGRGAARRPGTRPPGGGGAALRAPHDAEGRPAAWFAARRALRRDGHSAGEQRELRAPPGDRPPRRPREPRGSKDRHREEGF